MSQKYRHRGYRDSEREDRADSRPPVRRTLTTEERLHRKGLRHALDREANLVVRCHQCGTGTQNYGTIGFDTTCTRCQSPLHSCRTCKHFDVSARWQCRASIEKAIGDKISANRCSEYAPRLVLDATGRRTQPGPGPANGTPKRGGGGAREAFENLFKR